ncbi:MAG TPA: hypothetical protein VG165_00735 [Solirubrobacteraceae bacterium]|nr:hypothetical protein [Solirubrobacteraceae bacterium]
MRDPLNFFEPFEQLPAGHENQLTRAFLVVLRHSPLAHQAWLRLVTPDRALHQLDRATFRTQQGRILDVGERTLEERIPGISVIQAADAPAISGDVVDSDRRAIYDGVISYGNDLVVVFENKLDGPISDRQAREINRHDANIDFDPQPRAISWRVVLDTLSDLVDSERALLGGAEKGIIEDFLEFCQRNFPALLPFSSLRRCAGDPPRIARRLAAIIATIAPDPQDANGHKLAVTRARVRRASLPRHRRSQQRSGRAGLSPDLSRRHTRPSTRRLAPAREGARPPRPDRQRLGRRAQHALHPPRHRPRHHARRRRNPEVHDVLARPHR